MRRLVYGPVQQTHEHRFRPQPAGSLTLRQFVESLRRWTPEMRQVAQIALTRTEAERRSYLQGFHARHHERQPQAIDSFVRWAYSDPRLDHVPALLAELERTDAEYEGALDARGGRPGPHAGAGQDAGAARARLPGAARDGGREPVRAAIAGAPAAGHAREPRSIATIRQMRRRWLELYGDDPFFAED